jgi:hypothetical protein
MAKINVSVSFCIFKQIPLVLFDNYFRLIVMVMALLMAFPPLFLSFIFLVLILFFILILLLSLLVLLLKGYPTHSIFLCVFLSLPIESVPFAKAKFC